MRGREREREGDRERGREREREREGGGEREGGRERGRERLDFGCQLPPSTPASHSKWPSPTFPSSPILPHYSCSFLLMFPLLSSGGPLPPCLPSLSPVSPGAWPCSGCASHRGVLIDRSITDRKSISDAGGERVGNVRVVGWQKNSFNHIHVS